jgi:hypothetical protein
MTYLTVGVVFCSITITTKGKYAAIEAEAIHSLVNLLKDPVSEVRLNALKVQTIHLTIVLYQLTIVLYQLRETPVAAWKQ